MIAYYTIIFVSDTSINIIHKVCFLICVTDMSKISAHFKISVEPFHGINILHYVDISYKNENIRIFAIKKLHSHNLALFCLFLILQYC